MTDNAHVWVDPRRQGGEPCIHGTRLPTAYMASLVRQGGMQTVRTG